MSDVGFNPAVGVPLASDAWLADHLAQLRRDHHQRIRSAVQALVDIAESVERFCENPTVAELPPGWQEGLSVLRAKVAQALARQGVSAICAVGRQLDPQYHHVVEICREGGPPGTVVRQLRPGYMWHDEVLQTAEVVTVAATGNTSEQPQATPNIGSTS